MEPAEPRPITAQDHLALFVARGILHGFRTYYSEFREIMGRSKRRFEERDWTGLHQDADQRLQLYVRAVDGSAAYVEDILGDSRADAELWRRTQASYDLLTVDPETGDLGRAYFGTVKRRFIPEDAADCDPSRLEVTHLEEFVEEVVFVDRPRGARPVEELLRAILERFPFETPFVDLDGDIRQAATLIEDRMSGVRGQRMALLKPLFFRAKRAHIIGRVWSLGRFVPFVIALTNQGPSPGSEGPSESVAPAEPAGLRLAEVLVGQEETAALFSFTRSQFHVVTAHHRELMGFLKSLAPWKSPADLYASVGYNNLAKSAVLADLFQLLAKKGERFRRTPGISGTVMLTFEVPGSRFVIKLIRDRFLPRRVETTREKVKRRYRFVQYAERIGRIVDIFHFHQVRFQREWFDDSLLEELATSTPSTVDLDRDTVIFKELYVQRKVVPLDVYFRGDNDPAVTRRVVMDFGFLHKDLAARNIFTGDVVPNNYGVVSIGKRTMRVVSFDYDGYSRVTDMSFLDLGSSAAPQSDSADPTEDAGGDPWSVYDDWDSPEERLVIDEEWDVLPDKFRFTFGIPEAHKEEFERVHGELYTARWWTRVQAELSGRPEYVDGFPYHMIAR